MSKHTPGPWRYQTFDYFDPRVFGGDGSLVLAAEVSEADGRLIAAAPDLLEACKVALEYFADTAGEWFDTERDLADQLRAAIAKAEGTAK